MNQEVPERTYALRQVAAACPNRKGERGVHPQTILRRVKRGEFPPPDIEFSDGTKIWKQSTLQKVLCA